MNCIVCSISVVGGVSLGNGKILHTSCFEVISHDFTDSEHRVLSARTELERARSEVNAQNGLFWKVASFFNGSVSTEQLRIRLVTSEECLKAAENYFATVQVKALPIFDFLLDYPPDWESRRARVHARDGSCVACRSRQKLQVHHVTPLSRGGTNRIENLQLLCESCHKAAHGGRSFSGVLSAAPLAFAQRIQVIESAITDGKDVEFLYRKPSDASEKKRRVTPSELIQMNHEHDDGMTLCLQGYCHSRKATRVFALKRMTGTKRI